MSAVPTPLDPVRNTTLSITTDPWPITPLQAHTAKQGDSRRGGRRRSSTSWRWRHADHQAEEIALHCSTDRTRGSELAWVAPSQSNTLGYPLRLAILTGEGNDHARKNTKHPNGFAVGRVRRRGGSIYPRMGVAAVGSGGRSKAPDSAEGCGVPPQYQSPDPVHNQSHTR
jgi:hypothetical protein